MRFMGDKVLICGMALATTYILFKGLSLLAPVPSFEEMAKMQSYAPTEIGTNYTPKLSNIDSRIKPSELEQD